jgi:hypothetical protein
MLHREDPQGLIVITQPAHAWAAAQLGRQWGNERFGTFAPWEEVCLAAEQHDTALAGWEQSPTLNPATGRPHTYIDLPGAEHTGYAGTAARTVMTQNRYAALLVSQLFSEVWERYYTGPEAAAYAGAVRAFLARERSLQQRLFEQLRADPVYAVHASPEAVGRNRRLVMAWDALSLALCAGAPGPQTFAGIPAAAGPADLVLTPAAGDRQVWHLTPWPFQGSTARLTVEGRRLAPGSRTDEELRTALEAAPWLTLDMELRPG